jgi:hypothetical protein
MKNELITVFTGKITGKRFHLSAFTQIKKGRFYENKCRFMDRS